MKHLESVREAERRAQRRLPASVFNSVLAASEKGLAMDDNVRAFDELLLLPALPVGPAEVQTGVTIMGEPASFPVMLAPTGGKALHPDAEVAVAGAARTHQIPMGVSIFASKTLAEVTAAHSSVFFQVYWINGRDQMLRRLEHAREGGARGLIMTLDWSYPKGRDWGSPRIPERLSAVEALRYLPEVVLRPRWAASFLRARQVPPLTVPNACLGTAKAAPTLFDAFAEWRDTPAPDWDDIRWLREQWDGPFMVKGVSRRDDARRCVDIGATALSVSNHGGNNLDSAPASTRLLPGIARAVGNEIEVVVDGGVRRGADVVKALALGAHAVMIGRPYLWALAAGGRRGVEDVLDVLRYGMTTTLRAIGRQDVGDLCWEDVCSRDDLRWT